MTYDHKPLLDCIDKLSGAIKGYIDRSFDEVRKELDQLSERIASVEAKAGKDAS